jgi:sugar lactone lactonase YvrE
MRKVVVALAASLVLFAGCSDKSKPAGGTCSPPKGRIKPELFLRFGNEVNVPDGLALDKDQNIIMSVPNFVDKTQGMYLIKITFDANGKPKHEKWYDLQANIAHPDTGLVHPMGLEFGPDGNLYIADNQYFTSKDYKSRLLRVNVVDGKPVGVEVVADGFKLANAVRWQDNNVFVSDTFFDLPDKKNQSGVYRFSLDELNAGKVTLQPLAKDPHLIAQFTCKLKLPVWKPLGPDDGLGGADGVCFDGDGRLYCGNYNDGVITRVTFNDDGTVKEQKIVVDDPILPCSDGMWYDAKRDTIWVTDSLNNAICALCPKTLKLTQLWSNEDNDGSTGLLDQPCEPLVRGDQLIVVNFDMTFPGLKNSENDPVNTLSVFTLK